MASIASVRPRLKRLKLETKPGDLYENKTHSCREHGDQATLPTDAAQEEACSIMGTVFLEAATYVRRF